MGQKEAEKTKKVNLSWSGRLKSLRLNLKEMVKLNPQIFWFFLVFMAAFAVFFASVVPPRVKLEVGQVASFDIKAPWDVVDDAATERLRQEKIQSVPKAYDNDPRVLSDIDTTLDELRQKIATVSSSSNLSTQDIVKEIRPYVNETLSDADILAVVASSSESLDASFQKAKDIAAEVLSQGLKPENLEKGLETALARLAGDNSIPQPQVRLLSSFFAKNLKPNMILNEEETQKKINEALASVEPVKIRRGQFIVREGDVVTAEQLAILEKLGMLGSPIRFTVVSGSILMALIFTSFTYAYLYFYYPDFKSPKSSALIASVVVLSILAVKTVSEISGFLVPVAFGVMLASTLIDRRFGLFFGACLSFATGVITGFDLRFFTLSLCSGLAAGLSVKKAWNRAHLFKSGLLATVVSGCAYGGLGLIGVITLQDVNWRDIIFVLSQGLLSSVLAVGSLPLFESVFGILTPLRLIEISNPEHPLLHRLLLEAPGTYHHSIMVGNLAETAAWAIGADSLLARVGAYYHDVGKIKRPYLFSENQMFGMENPHEKMSPNLSSAVIISHVKDGLELARQHKVPPAIQKFIAEHHGTTLASFFYTKASENMSKDGRPPEEWDFRYEGPRPSTKETAIVMLADGVEAATRALSKPTPARIESTVRKVIHDRLFDHQLDRSDLTLKELDMIAEAFTRVLVGTFHTRVEYPGQAGASSSHDDSREVQTKSNV